MRRLALAALFLGCIVPVAPAEGEGDELDPLASIRGSEFLAHVKWLADDAQGGRLTGTADERRATQYVADHFRSWGLEPAGEDGTWFQLFKAPSRAAIGKKNAIQVGTRSLTPGKQFRPAGTSPTMTATGRLVFAGYGYSDATYDDYDGLDVDGAIVVAIRVTVGNLPPGVPRPRGRFFVQTLLTQNQIAAAQNAGAAGLILIPGTGANDAVGLVPGGGRRSRMSRTRPPTIPLLFAQRSALKRLVGAPGFDPEAWEKQTQQDGAPAPRGAIGDAQATVATEVVTVAYQGRNVIGMLEGSDPELKNEFVVIGAHVDHVGHNEAGNARDRNNEIHNGADDNASGTAGMLELAQAFARSRFRPARSMLFMAFSGEELGLLGSRHWTRNPTRPISDVVAMINLDMIGRSVNGRVIAEATDSSPGFKDLCKRHNETLKKLDPAQGVDLRFSRGVRGDSDHASFYGAKVPVIFFFTGLHKDYHNATDDWDKINVSDAEKAIRLAFLCAAELTAAPERPAYKAVKRASRGGRRGTRVRLGVFPDYDFEGQGARVTDVVDGSPAAKAGMKAGDVIVRIGERDVGNMQDFMKALQSHKPGDATKIIVVRDGTKKTLNVKFSAR